MPLYDQILAGLFPNNMPQGLLGNTALRNAQNQGLLSFGTGMMAGATSIGKPVSFGQALNQGVQAGQQAYNQSAMNGVQLQQMAQAQQDRIAQQTANQKMAAYRESLAARYDQTNPPLAAAIRANDNEMVKQIMAQGKKPDTTALQKNLEAAGITPDDPRYRQTILASLTKPGVAINMNPGEPKANEALGKAIGTRLAGQLESGDKAATNLQTLTLMESAAAQLEKAGGSVGALAEPKAFATSLMQAVNIDPTSLGLPSDAGPSQLLNSLGNKLTLGKIGGEGGMPANNFSDADRKFIESTVPRLSDTPSAFKAKIFIDKRMAERSVKIGRIIDDGYTKGNSASEINAEIAKVKSQPLFTPDEIKNIQATSQAGQDSGQPQYDPNRPQPRRVIRNPQTGKLEFEQQGAPQGLSNPYPQGSGRAEFGAR